MDCQDYITESVERKKGQHLQREERGAIQHLKNAGYTNRAIDLSVTELPEAMKRKQHKDSKPREHKKNFGTDISQRPEIAALRIEEGHWEGDTVVGKRGSKEAVVLSLLEKKTENYMLMYKSKLKMCTVYLLTKV